MTTAAEPAPPGKRLLGFLLEIRKTIVSLGCGICLGTFGFYFLSPAIFATVQNHLHQQLAFFTVAEPFVAHVKLALFVTLFLLMPWIVFCFWRAMARPFALSAKDLAAFVFFTSLLFYLGTLFCYFVTLPFGVNFLLGFATEQLKSVISMGKFVSFVTIFVLAFGLIFELPIFMIFFARAGICPRSTFEKNRRYALLAISIVAALLTPTPDVVNLLLMGAPLYLLYEMGIVVLKIMKIN
ncbi:MAG: twin-arginine translocase subunit TatC [Proteobacteria bacterium]|nr:twin-arginine translocase subunit TatC [Pseudomonadota bacterium]MBU4296871.1 twin-arginine translocase subunit TatC [Pseudomonadota bacterium]MCG2746509.1 twin-arginine translocase subunit TatC [Desulfobulbaceae bacterium]